MGLGGAYMDASSPSEAEIARVPRPDRIVPYTMVVGPPFSRAEPIVSPMPSHDDNTVRPKATAGLSEIYLYKNRKESEQVVHENLPRLGVVRDATKN